MERTILTLEQAISCLNEGDTIHTFANPGNSILLGADRSRDAVIDALSNAIEIEIGGPSCKNLGHGLVLWKDENHPLFIECNMKVLEALDTDTL